ncbi:hypothetical protein EMIHUDRAFT_458330 [Emiliania huxleyi CCMP1516]|uniref:Uncharacterized protein n=2 Tax=Emiliania huxleyi TaxID=2903 RepID=A0A0D3JDJ5_EMIH1|nr:hypothetical protein EMIHUDRAFT_458330 [Emiliania huxleyi CCMP1516]EOD21580.1 hypothetical protein EMIHUDRAFT_458330 [Emiliania huxleyi CCMP1516]|eukprot:XP_005774009.1 hypothetical protein EMIHUDRAFT_458330 [Emiliania huxleyi CCMP1516]
MNEPSLSLSEPFIALTDAEILSAEELPAASAAHSAPRVGLLHLHPARLLLAVLLATQVSWGSAGNANSSIVGELIAMNRGDVGGRLTPPHTLDALVSLGAAAFGKHEASPKSGEGILLLPEHRLAMCIIPKNGCTTLKWVAMVLLGHSPSSVCGCKSSKWGCLGNSINMHSGNQSISGRYWNGSLQVHSEGTLRSHMDAVRAAFTSPSWTVVGLSWQEGLRTQRTKATTAAWGTG